MESSDQNTSDTDSGATYTVESERKPTYLGYNDYESISDDTPTASTDPPTLTDSSPHDQLPAGSLFYVSIGSGASRNASVHSRSSIDSSFAASPKLTRQRALSQDNVNGSLPKVKDYPWRRKRMFNSANENNNNKVNKWHRSNSTTRLFSNQSQNSSEGHVNGSRVSLFVHERTNIQFQP